MRGLVAPPAEPHAELGYGSKCRPSDGIARRTGAEGARRLEGKASDGARRDKFRRAPPFRPSPPGPYADSRGTSKTLDLTHLRGIE
jgi:hypothetical protein